MERSSQRKIIHVEPTWTLHELMAALAHALSGTGPALSTTPLSRDLVESNCAMVIATTGSSGIAKEVALSATALLTNARSSLKFLGAVAGERWSLLLPTTHVAGINVLIRSLELGTEPIDLRNAERYVNVDYTAIVPTQLFNALHGDEKLLHHLLATKKVLVGGAALSPSLAQEAESAGINIVTTYGSTETAGGCIYDGYPLDEVGVEIENGHIVITGKVLALGYLNHPELWIDRSRFVSPDLGEMVNGRLSVLGRSDDVIISGGSNISLQSVEETLHRTFPDLLCAAVGVDDERWGRALHIAYVGSLNIDVASAALVSALGDKAKPKGFHQVRELPLMGIGKVDRKTLEEMLR